MPYVLGVDPDLHRTGLGIIQPTSSRGTVLRAIGVAKIPTKVTGEEAVVLMARRLAVDLTTLLGEWKISCMIVEGQQVYTGKSNARPNDLIRLAQVAGAALAHGWLVPALRCPRPQEWKGSVPKGISQARICSRHKIAYESLAQNKAVKVVVPPPNLTVIGGKKLTQSDWSHIVDAIGLADWGAKIA